jgi:hypothetical protein
LIIKYKCTAGGFSGETPPGENFDAKFDGDDDPVADDPGHTMVSVKLLNPHPVGLTHKRKRKIVSISPMSVAAGGESIHRRFSRTRNPFSSTFDSQKHPSCQLAAAIALYSFAVIPRAFILR